MRMKRWMSLLLCAALLAALAIPAAAEEAGADTRLARVTQAVKTTLGLDTDGYETFQGDCYEQELASVWTLRWSGSAGSLTVEALEDGTVVSYRLTEPEAAEGIGGGLPSFPQGDPEAAAAAAEAFMDRVLDPAVESVRLEAPENADRLDSAGYLFTGVIRLHDLPSPLSYSLTVRPDGEILRFRRDAAATSWLGGIPDAAPAVDASEAALRLRETCPLRLEYVLPEGEGTEAVLRYLPDRVSEFYVDAQTGELVDLSALENAMYGGGAGSSNAAGDAAAAESGLSEAEQAGIAGLEGVRSQQELDALLREIREYGLNRYTLASAVYSRSEGGADDAETVLCTLRYSRAARDHVFRRTITVDARTGEVLYVSSSAPWDETARPALSVSQAQAKAESFLRAQYGSHASHLELYAADDDTGDGAPYYRFTFARKENGYFFPADAYTVGIDAADGSVYSLSYQYSEDVTFAPAEGLISAEAALDAWMATYDVALSYLAVPEALTGSDSVTQRLRQQGLQSFYVLKLGYTLERSGRYLGIDAKSGEPVQPQAADAMPAYADLNAHWAKGEVERLAQYGIGYDAALFQPRKAATQLDLVCLLASIRGYRLDPSSADAEQRNEAYAVAYEMGALTREQRRDDAVLTRGDAVKLLLNSAGYGSVARLNGIFTCSYADRASIPGADLGYAALAQGLGLIRDAYNGAKAATRAEVAVMLSRLMES